MQVVVSIQFCASRQVSEFETCNRLFINSDSHVQFSYSTLRLSAD